MKGHQNLDCQPVQFQQYSILFKSPKAVKSISFA